jgi:hypothetical protein
MINEPDQKKKPELQKHEIDFMDLIVKMINIPLKYGFAPKCWCKFITIMIEKDPGSP